MTPSIDSAVANRLPSRKQAKAATGIRIAVSRSLMPAQPQLPSRDWLRQARFRQLLRPRLEDSVVEVSGRESQLGCRGSALAEESAPMAVWTSAKCEARAVCWRS